MLFDLSSEIVMPMINCGKSHSEKCLILITRSISFKNEVQNTELNPIIDYETANLVFIKSQTRELGEYLGQKIEN